LYSILNTELQAFLLMLLSVEN